VSRNLLRYLVVSAAILATCSAHARVLHVHAGADAAERLQTALIEARPGDTVQLGAGRFDAPDSLSLDVAHVTLRGLARDKTILAFDKQSAGADGLLITADGALIEDLSVENPKGNGIKSKGVDGVTFRRVRVEWTGGPKESNGAYGVYPVSSSHVLIDHVLVRGASDAGIYVGQSREIVLRDSEAAYNVAGIEIENCYHADVRDNLSTHNAGGILVFDLPGLPQMGGHDVRVFRNRVIANDTPNFAPKGNIVAKVPTGTGVMVMANRNVHVFDNTIDANGSVAVLLVAYVNAFTDPAYDPLPRDVSIHGNTIGKNGYDPTFEGGHALAQALGGAIPPVMWDGVVRFRTPSGSPSNDVMNLNVRDGPVVNLHLGDQGMPLDKANPTVTATLGAAVSTEPAPVMLPEGQADREDGGKGRP